MKFKFIEEEGFLKMLQGAFVTGYIFGAFSILILVVVKWLWL